MPLNGAGWACLAGAMVAGGAAAGAWGVSVAALAAMSMAFVLLCVAAFAAKNGKATASQRRVGMWPDKREPLGLVRRCITFVVVAVLAGLVSIAIAVAIRGFGAAAGLVPADYNVLAVSIMPIAWAILAFALLMNPSRRSQAVILLACCLPAIPATLIGGGA
ncbi:hypothetical protein [Novosphingobium aquimarinum]|uniref:hypothetical protein n=1 Tax=Novosphingobium aquimarinum TaxID=2682494 RepID=UPI0012EC6EC0|nr:hypothetical protein [Novosphingobium aquimarinum]